MCGQTFRAAGTVSKGRMLRWQNHSTVQKKILQHARDHGAVGYTPHRNLDRMRLDWARSPDETSTVMPISRQHVPQGASPSHCYYYASDPRSSEDSTFCVDCAEWERTTEFRRGASTCKTCLRITCAACGSLLRQDKYRREDVYNFLNKKIMLAAENVARKERNTEDRNTRHTKENIAVSVVALDVEYTRARQPFGGPKEGA